MTTNPQNEEYLRFIKLLNRVLDHNEITILMY